MNHKELKIAIVHDWFLAVGGAEKVIKQMLLVYPNAQVFCLFDLFDDEQRQEILQGKTTEQSPFAALPMLRSQYRKYLPLFFSYIERLDLSEFDLVISSSHSIAKGVKTRENQMHICYCHTPARYAWDMRKTYLEQIPKPLRGSAFNRFNHMKEWDLVNSGLVDRFIANSNFVAERISRNYGRESTVIHPPVNVDFFEPPSECDPSPRSKPFYLVVSRMVFYKRVELIVNAFNQMPDRDLLVIGEGPQLRRIKNSADNGNVTFLDFQCDEKIKTYMQHAEACIFAAIEDFGITCVEAQACGTPVICFDHGGYKETVVHNRTGLLYSEQSIDSLKQAIMAFETSGHIDKQEVRSHSEKFGADRFREQIGTFVEEALASYEST